MDKNHSDISLENILKSFNSSIREEHAWALCYQCAKFFIEALRNNRTGCYVLSDVNQVILQIDGNVHPNTLYFEDAGHPRSRLQDVHQLITGLGFVIYNALDQGNTNREERAICRDLEKLITDMISTQEQPLQETDDEGIEKDSEEGDEATATHITLQEVMQRCERHVSSLTRTQADAHYKAVVRALVAEAVELATFLEKVAQGASRLHMKDAKLSSELDQLKFADWARFWMQVMGELRTGVKLRKVQCSRAPVEYELTPYEILMKDIRSCRFNLKKIMIGGDIPSRVSKDAHVVILEFIRSRPPLKKVSDRKLTPQTRKLTPREQLLNSIRKGRNLRPIRTETVGSEEKPVRKLIKVDFSQFDDDDDDDDLQLGKTPESESRASWMDEYAAVAKSTFDVYDLATQHSEFYSVYHGHTLGNYELGSQSVPQSRPCSRQSCASSDAESMPPEVARTYQNQYLGKEQWQEGMSLEDRLSLTLEEIVHIRSVLTKAELEGLPTEGHVKTDVENRKVCFLCLKTRFGIFGPWGQRCSLCKRTVCSKCCCKMYIPMEHFSSVPVVLLSPSILSTPDDDSSSGIAQSLINRMTESDTGPYLSSSTSSFDEGNVPVGKKFRKPATLVDKLKASQMVVCTDCKTMVSQIIKSARANRTAVRNKTIQSLSLNLSPVF